MGTRYIKGREPTPEHILKMLDTSGVETSERTCFTCGAKYVPKGDDKGVCDSCYGNRIVNTSHVPEEILPQGERRCLICSKVHEATPSIGIVDSICPECKSTYKDTAILRCVKCRNVVGRLAPKVHESGFIIRPGTVLSIDGCNICNADNKESSVVIELDEWIRNKRSRKTFSRP